MRYRARLDSLHIDRKKHEVDIAERVLQGGVWAGPSPDGRGHIVTSQAELDSEPAAAPAVPERFDRDDER